MDTQKLTTLLENIENTYAQEFKHLSAKEDTKDLSEQKKHDDQAKHFNEQYIAYCVDLRMMLTPEQNKIAGTLSNKELVALLNFKLSNEKHGEDVITMLENPACGVYLKGGKDIPCLALFEDEVEGWVTLSQNDITVRQYTRNEIM